MMESRRYYSTQTLLAYMVQTFILRHYHLFVAVEFDPSGNHPTSNPRLVAARWCRVALGERNVEALGAWETHKATLRAVLVDWFSRGAIGQAELEEGQRLIADATLRFAAPVLFVLSDAGIRLEPGHVHPGYEATEEEYLVRGWPPEDHTQVRFMPCSPDPD